jgi:hypothetical protein
MKLASGESLDVPRLDARPGETRPVLLAHTEVGAEVEQLVLDPPELAVEARHEAGGERDAQERGQLVDGAVGGHPRVVLRQPVAAGEPGLAAVAGAGVDLRQARHGDRYPTAGARTAGRAPG